MLLLQRERWTKRRRRRYRRRRHRRRRRRPLVSIAPTSTAADFRSLATKVISQKKKRFSETLNRNQLRSRVRRNLTGAKKSEYEQKNEFPTTRPILGQNLVSQHE